MPANRLYLTIARAACALTLFVIAAPVVHAGDDFKSDFDQANRLYDQGKYQEAKKFYDSIVADGHYSANVFYNLGNTNFRLKDSGAAILNYERALALQPNQPDVQANLEYARAQTGAKVPDKDWRDLIVADLNVNIYCWSAAIAGWILIFAIVSILCRGRAENQLAWVVSVLSIIALAYCGFAIYQLNKDETVAIVTAKSAEAHYAPTDSSTLAATLPVGSRVRILERRGVWVYCALPDNNRAWIAADAIERVRLKTS